MKSYLNKRYTFHCINSGLSNFILVLLNQVSYCTYYYVCILWLVIQEQINN